MAENSMHWNYTFNQLYKKGDTNMITLKSANSAIVLLALLAGLLIVPLMAQAEDTDPDGVKLKEILQKSEAPEKLKGAQAAGNMDFETAYGVCALEAVTVIGTAIWVARNKLDACKLEYIGIDYCVGYSTNCNHYKWKANCLKEKNLCKKIEKGE